MMRFVLFFASVSLTSALTSNGLKPVRTHQLIQRYLVTAPQFAVKKPGQCEVPDKFSPFPLIEKISIAPDVRVLTFGLADKSKPLGLSTCAALLVRGGADAEGKPIVKPYTPVSTNALLGKFELMVKVYPNGTMSNYLDSLEVGQTVDFQHSSANVKIQYPFLKVWPFQTPRIGMIVGGTGITPMIQALHALLGNPSDRTHVSMLYANKKVEDILAKETLDAWTASHGNRLSVTHVLSREPTETAWTGQRGHIDRELIQMHLPAPSENCMIFICGPPAMYDTFSGPRGEKKLTGLLADMGYKAEQVYKF